MAIVNLYHTNVLILFLLLVLHTAYKHIRLYLLVITDHHLHATYNFSFPIQLSYPSGSTQYQLQGHSQSVPHERTDTVPSPGAPYSIQTHSSVFASYHGSSPPTKYNGACTVPHNYGGNSDAIVSMETITRYP